MLFLISALCLVLFVAFLIRTVFGFGDSMIAMPFLTILLGIKTAAPFLAVISFASCVAIIWKDREKFSLKGIKRLIFFTAIGIPIGIYYMGGANENLIKIVLALIIMAFAAFRLLNPSVIHLKNDRWAPIFGLLSGILGGAYNTNGPPIIVYGAARRWDSLEFRSTLQGVFLPTNLFIIIGHAVAGNYSIKVFVCLGWSVPAFVAALLLGNWVKERIPADKFSRYVYYCLLGIAGVLIVNAVK